MPPTSTVGTPAAQGAATAGTQGMGVSTPMAAAVAAATVGLAGHEHIPKVGGRLSMMVACSWPQASTVCWEVTGSTAGAAPNEQVHIVVLTTGFAIIVLLPVSR